MSWCIFDNNSVCMNNKSPETFNKRCIEADNLLLNEQTFCRFHADVNKLDDPMTNDICLYLFNWKCANKLCSAWDKSCVRNGGESCVFFMSQDTFKKQNEKETTKSDTVMHPSHYCQGGIEYIKAIEASMTPEEFQGYCKGNVMKYIWRFREKNGLEDLKKAQVYLGWMIESKEKQERNTH